jgi:hypothetical protein
MAQPPNTKKHFTHTLRTLAVVILTIGMAGCQSSSPSQYISPRIVGRVVDAQSQQPVAGARIRRLKPQDPNVAQVVKGGEQIDQSPAIRTGSDGSFVLVSEKSLALFQRLGWYSVSLAITHPNYESLTTEFTLVNATNTPSGEPLVKAGDIHLQPKPD